MNTDFIQQRVEVDSPSLSSFDGGYGGGGVTVVSEDEGVRDRLVERRVNGRMLGVPRTGQEYGGGDEETGGDWRLRTISLKSSNSPRRPSTCLTNARLACCCPAI
jgi:hypothetical protein